MLYNTMRTNKTGDNYDVDILAPVLCRLISHQRYEGCNRVGLGGERGMGEGNLGAV